MYQILVTNMMHYLLSLFGLKFGGSYILVVNLGWGGIFWPWYFLWCNLLCFIRLSCVFLLHVNMCRYIWPYKIQPLTWRWYIKYIYSPPDPPTHILQPPPSARYIPIYDPKSTFYTLMIQTLQPGGPKKSGVRLFMNKIFNSSRNS